MKCFLITGDQDRKSSRDDVGTVVKATVGATGIACFRGQTRQVLYGCTTPFDCSPHILASGAPRSHRPDIVIKRRRTSAGFDTRRLLKTAFDAEIFDFYGMTEMGLSPGSAPHMTATTRLKTDFD